MIKMKRIIILFLLIGMMAVVSAFDNQTIIIMGGDEETLILAIGDLENSPIGKNVYTAPGIIPPTGGTGTGGTGARFDSGIICNFTREFLTYNEFTIEELLFKINNKSNINITQEVLDQYINNFEDKCNMTIEQKKEVIKKIAFPFILIILIILTILSYYHREKIKKWLIVLFDDDEEDLDLLDIEGD